MNQEEKRKYQREWYRRNAERLKAKQRAKHPGRKSGLENAAVEEPDCCLSCKRWSSAHIKWDTGWCMRHRRMTKKKDICQDYLTKVKIRYEQTVHPITVFSGE